MFRLWRQHGMSVPDTVRHGSATVIFEDYPVRGYNYRMTDMQAAIGREQLKRLPQHRRPPPRPGRALPRALARIWTGSRPRKSRLGEVELAELLRRLDDGIDQQRLMQAMLDAGWRPGAGSCAPISSRRIPT